MIEINTKWNYTREVLPEKNKVVLVITPYSRIKFYPAQWNGVDWVSTKGDDMVIRNVTLWADIEVSEELVKHAVILSDLENILS